MAKRFEMRVELPLGSFALHVEVTSEAQALGVFGPSGSGKTSLLETIAGLRSGARGYLRCGDEVWLDSLGGLCVSAWQRGVGYVPQEHRLFPHKPVRGNLEMGRRRSSKGFAQRMAEVVEMLELEPLLERRTGALSGGERQRVALGRALCSGPKLLLLDEPLASLDGGLRGRLLPYLRRVRERFAVPMVVVSHQEAELVALCDEVVALRDGRVEAQGEPVEVLTRPGIYRGAGGRYANLLPAVVGPHAGRLTRLHLGRDGAGEALAVGRLEGASGSEVQVSVGAHELIVAREAVAGISVRNRLRGEVAEIKEVGEGQLILVRLPGGGLPKVVVEVTAEAVHELDLAVGMEVYLLAKASALRVFG